MRNAELKVSNNLSYAYSSLTRIYRSYITRLFCILMLLVQILGTLSGPPLHFNASCREISRRIWWSAPLLLEAFFPRCQNCPLLSLLLLGLLLSQDFLLPRDFL